VPFLRVIRDRRGYETTYLMHLYREGQRQRSRILYLFRSPGGVRVGRGALEPDVLRLIEAQNPGITFDWKEVRDGQQYIEMAPEPRRRKAPRSEEPVPAAPEPAAPTTTMPVAAAAARFAAARFEVPSSIAGATPDEQVAFLARWYPLIRERIPRRTSDPLRQDALLALNERLNPAAWTDADQIASGLQQAAVALERLSRVFAKRRRRARRRPQAPPPTDQAPSES
jgi:hypothetical protein